MHLSVYGLRRSGNHAIIGWLINNFSNGSPLIQVKHPLIITRDTCFINDILECYRNDISSLRIDSTFARSNFENIIISYEDVSPRVTTEFSADMRKVTVIRDIKNVTASRLKRMKEMKNSEGHQKRLRVDEKFVRLWAEHAIAILEERVTGIIFENWSSSKIYRDEIAEKLGIKNIDITDTVMPYGGGSSFSGMTPQPPTANELRRRYLQVEPDQNIAKLLESEEITFLRSCLGYKDSD